MAIDTIMDDLDRVTLPDEHEIASVHAIVRKLTTTKRPILPETTFERRWARIEHILWMATIPFAVLASITAALAFWFDLRQLLLVTLWTAIIAELLGLAMMSSGIIRGLPFLWRLRKSPYEPMLQLVSLSCEQDLPYLRELIQHRKETLQYVLVQFKQERSAFERRSGMLAGSIDKIGIFAAIAALIVTVNNLQNIGGVIPWGAILGPILLSFYGLALSSAHLTQKMDRVAALLELIIQLRK